MSIAEKSIRFKSLEGKVFNYVCKCSREIIKNILESYDEEIRESRNKKEYRSKGKRRRTIKTVMERWSSRGMYTKQLPTKEKKDTNIC